MNRARAPGVTAARGRLEFLLTVTAELAPVTVPAPAHAPVPRVLVSAVDAALLTVRGLADALVA